MALTRCKECGRDVSSTLLQCPHCGFKLVPSSRSSDGFKAAMAAIALGVVAMIFSPRDKPQAPPEAPDHHATVRGLCMAHIKANLHDPGSAEFEHSSSAIVTQEGQRWTVVRPVRAKNAFNALRRAMYACEFIQQGNNFNLTSLKQIN